MLMDIRMEQSERFEHATARQQEVLDLIASRGTAGVTWDDVSNAMGIHHGSASGCLSTLHKQGKVFRLSDKRGGRKIYVLPENVSGRQTESYNARDLKKCPSCGMAL